MKAVYKVNDKLSFEHESSNQRELFEWIASVQEVFGNEPSDGADPKFVVRVVDVKGGKKAKYYEVRSSRNSRLKLSFGVHENGETIFPKRKDADGNWLSDNGFVEWKPAE